MARKTTAIERIKQALVWADGQPMTARELAAEAGCSLSWAYRVLRRLTDERMATFGGHFATRAKVGRQATTFRISGPESADVLAEEQRQAEMAFADAVCDEDIEAEYADYYRRRAARRA